MTRPDLAAGPRFWHLLALAVLLWGGGYLARDLWEPDEARYAYVAREMRESGNYSMLTRHGEFYAHKPPLMFWLIDLTSFATGGHIGSVAARLPSLLGALLALWATAALARRWAGEAAAWPSLAVLGTSYLFYFQGSMGQIDALLCGLQMMALACLFRYNDEGRPWLPAAAYVLMGLAVLAKGPVGFIVPLGAYLAATAAAGEGARLKRWHFAWGPLVTLAFPAAWLLWAFLAGAPESYFRELLFAQNVERAAGSYGHAQPFYYFIPHFLGEFMPWTLFLGPAWAALRERPALRRRLAAWGLFVIVFFSFSASKRNMYILLAYPAAAILVGAAFDRFTRRDRWAGMAAAGLAVLIGLGLAGAAFSPKVPIGALRLVPIGVVMLAAGAWLFNRIRREGPGRTRLLALAALFAVFEMYAGAVLLPALNPLKTPWEMAAAAQTRLGPGDRLWLYRMNGEIHAFYAGVPGTKVDDPEELRRMAAQRGRGGMAVFDARDWDALDPTIKAMFKAHPFRMGGKKLVWAEVVIHGAEK
jgi:4-amino-4-deoxy-L-arabinose transferase-like glycosyltransferase